MNIAELCSNERESLSKTFYSDLTGTDVIENDSTNHPHQIFKDEVLEFGVWLTKKRIKQF